MDHKDGTPSRGGNMGLEDGHRRERPNAGDQTRRPNGRDKQRGQTGEDKKKRAKREESKLAAKTEWRRGGQGQNQ